MFDFPNAPATNQTYQGYIWDGEKWTSNATLSPPPVPPPLITTQRGYIFGLHLFYATSTSLGVQPGMAMDSGGSTMMTLPAMLTKTTAAWAAGNNAGGLDTGPAMAAGAWYHWYLIYNPTTLAVDVVFSGTMTPDAGPTALPAGFTKFRRLGSMLYSASGWTLFTQHGDEFTFSVPISDASNAAMVSTAAGALYQLSVPPGVSVLARVRGSVAVTTANSFARICSPDEPVTAANVPGGNRTSTSPVAASSAGTQATISVRTNTAGQIRAVANLASTSLTVVTYGWIDRRGKDQ